MAFEKITREELEKVGVTTLPDIPSLQAEEMKRKFEETAKELIVPHINKLIDELMLETAAAVIGAEVPDGLPEETEKTVQKVIQAVFDELENHKNDDENPHKVTAHQTGAYTKKETDQAIGEKVQQIGAGDMAKSVYDTHGLGVDVYDYGPHLYKATFLLDSWNGSGPYTQTAVLTPADGGPDVTGTSVFVSPVMCEQTTNQKTNEQLQDALAVLNAGQATLGENQVTVTVFEKPESDIEAIWQIRKGGAS